LDFLELLNIRLNGFWPIPGCAAFAADPCDSPGFARCTQALSRKHLPSAQHIAFGNRIIVVIAAKYFALTHCCCSNGLSRIRVHPVSAEITNRAAYSVVNMLDHAVRYSVAFCGIPRRFVVSLSVRRTLDWFACASVALLSIELAQFLSIY